MAERRKNRGQDNQVKCKTRLGAQGTQAKGHSRNRKMECFLGGSQEYEQPEDVDERWHLALEVEIWRGWEGQFADILPLLFSPRL